MSTRPDIVSAAGAIGVEPATLAAVVAVESSGAGLVEGRPLIRLEVHHLWHHAGPALRPQVDARFRVGGPKPWEGHQWRPAPGASWEPLHVGQGREWRAYDTAYAIAPRAAMRATSWGLGQVIAGNATEDEAKDGWRRAGFDTIEAFVASQYTEAGQVLTMARWMAADPALLAALRGRDWSTVARLYNGAGQVDVYAGRLASAYRKAA